MLSEGLSATLAHIISATSKSAVATIMSFLVGIWLSSEQLTRARISHIGGLLNNKLVPGGYLVAGVLLVLATKTVSQHQSEKRSVVFLKATVRCRSHQEEMTCQRSKKLAQFVPFSLLKFIAEIRDTHSVCLIHNIEVPFTTFTLGLITVLIIRAG
jgi:hypothetical protein